MDDYLKKKMNYQIRPALQVSERAKLFENFFLE